MGRLVGGRARFLWTVALVGAAGAAGLLVGRARADGITSSGALTYTGTLTDAMGVPLTGSKSIQVALYDASANGAQKCTITQSVPLVAGQFSIQLPDACTAAAQANPDLWVEVTADGTSLGRSKLGAVPYAVEANHAVNATNASNAAGPLAATIAGHQSGLTSRLEGPASGCRRSSAKMPSLRIHRTRRCSGKRAPS